MNKAAKNSRRATAAELRKALRSAEARHQDAKGKVREAKAAA